MAEHRADFLGAFAVLRRDDRYLLVANERRIAGVTQRTWDLPGGHVEAGELVPEALRRELREETGLTLLPEPEFVFCQEGERIVAGVRQYAWRSFFFAIDAVGDAVASSEVLAVRWMTVQEIADECRAPYHDSFRQWLQSGGRFFRSTWRD
jgi:8-oxo-dGTP diphosphatase